MNKLKSLSLAGLLIGATAFWGCNKEEDPIIIGEGFTIEELLELEPNIYFAGLEWGKHKGKAKLWKRGASRDLTNGNNYAEALSVHVSGSDVFVAGSEETSQEGKHIAKLWKNGTARNLTNYGMAHSVFVSGSDVYVAGVSNLSDDYLSWSATVWKNSEEPYHLGGTSWANSVYVSDNIVYASGNAAAKFGGQGHALLLQDGVPQFLADVNANDICLSDAASVFVSGGNVYVAGFEERQSEGNWIYNRVPMLWINGEPHKLSAGDVSSSPFSEARSVFVSGSDVYVCGTDKGAQGKRMATLWKNGVAQNLIDDNSVESHAHCVFVSGNDVYVLLFVQKEMHSDKWSVLWKNGVAKTISSSDIVINSMFGVD